MISALNNIDVEIDNLEALNQLTVQDVRVADIDNVANNNRVLNNALNRNEVDIDILRNFLNNADIDVDIQNVLNDLNVNAEDVVAVKVLDGGDVVIFVE